jgi:hypothetical protein
MNTKANFVSYRTNAVNQLFSNTSQVIRIHHRTFSFQINQKKKHLHVVSDI